jgi:glucose-6-phosphate isomerase
MQDNTRSGVASLEVEPGVSTGDYLNGFWLGTRAALEENGRASISLICDKLDARTLGALIALYERTVGLYAQLVEVNAYHQPGVEAGKKAAALVLTLQTEAVAYLKTRPTEAFKIEDLAQALGKYEQAETLMHILEHLAANKRFVHKKGKTYQYKA